MNKKEVYKLYSDYISYHQMACTGNATGKNYPKVVTTTIARNALKMALSKLTR